LLLRLNKEKLIFLFCSGLLLFVLALPEEKTVDSEPVEISTVNKKVDTEKSQEEELEQRVQHILQGVEGVGEADVMVSLSSEKSVSMFEEEQVREVLGIIISADGGGSSVVKAEISEAMEALFGLPSHKIKVLKRVKEGV
jgi:stage III sporulation protein AG